jgi:uncharacterized protein (DUF488 family)
MLQGRNREISVPTLFTIGHSTHSAEHFIELLREHGIALLVDIRQFPGSRRHPHFAREQMAEWLPEAGIEYVHEVGLGGRRRGRDDSPHVYWQNESFRAYADYMQTPEFEAALERLIALARERPTAIMCSEALPWRCHRRLVADALVARGWEVRDILAHKATPHLLDPHARVVGGQLIYDQVDRQKELFS